MSMFVCEFSCACFMYGYMSLAMCVGLFDCCAICPHASLPICLRAYLTVGLGSLWTNVVNQLSVGVCVC